MITLLQVPSLEKIFLDEDISKKKEIDSMPALRGERVSYQILYTDVDQVLKVEVQADPRLTVTLREVGNVPSAMPAWERETDEWYLRKTPGLYPDVLYPAGAYVSAKKKNCHSLFVACEIPEETEAVLAVREWIYKEIEAYIGA